SKTYSEIRCTPASFWHHSATNSRGAHCDHRTESSASMPLYKKCTAPVFLDTILLLSGHLHDGPVPGCSGIAGTTQSVLFDEPLGVIAGNEVADRVTNLVDGLVDPAVHDLLFEGTEEPLDDAVRLGLAGERGAGSH